MVSLGQFFVILAGGIDLSVGSIIGFSGMAASMFNNSQPTLPAFVVLIVGVLIGTAFGALNGALVTFGKVSPIITTLGTMSIFRGVTFVLSQGQWVTAHEMTEAYMLLPHGNFLGITNLIWWGVLVSAIIYYVSRFTRSGREVFAIGGNKTAAKFVGVSERKITMMTFTISGMFSGLVGVMWTARYAAAVNETATGFELQTVAACVIGGVSIAAVLLTSRIGSTRPNIALGYDMEVITLVVLGGCIHLRGQREFIRYDHGHLPFRLPEIRNGPHQSVGEGDGDHHRYPFDCRGPASFW